MYFGVRLNKKFAEKKLFFIDEFLKKILEQHYEILRFPLEHLRSNHFRIRSGKISSSLEYNWRPNRWRPPDFRWRPHIFVGDSHIFVGDPYFHLRPHIFVKDPHIVVGERESPRVLQWWWFLPRLLLQLFGLNWIQTNTNTSTWQLKLVILGSSNWNG